MSVSTLLVVGSILVAVCHGGVSQIDDLHKERLSDASVSPHQGSEHEFDHEAILGSKDAADEFEELPAEEAKKRLKIIAHRMDLNKDGAVDAEELKKWILNSFYTLTKEESTERFEEEDKNKDGKISWEEHFSENFAEGSVLHQHHQDDIPRMLEEDRQLFTKADKDADKLLDKEEFARFSHPHEFAEMHDLLLEQTMARKDTNKDGKLSLDEFLAEDPQSGRELSQEHLTTEKERFEYDLDRNNDRFLDSDEVKHWIILDNDEIAVQEVEHLMENSDDNHDGKLSIKEIEDHHEIFVGSEATDYGEHLHKLQKEEL